MFRSCSTASRVLKCAQVTDKVYSILLFYVAICDAGPAGGKGDKAGLPVTFIHGSCFTVVAVKVHGGLADLLH